MTGWRIGWVAGDPELVALYRKVKTNIDSGTPTFIQNAGFVWAAILLPLVKIRTGKDSCGTGDAILTGGRGVSPTQKS